MKINPGNARGLLVPQGDRPFSFVVYSSEIRDFGVEVSEKDKALEKEPDEPLHWWELFAKLGEGMSRWFKAFITAQF